MKCPECGTDINPNEALDLEYRPCFHETGSAVEVEMGCDCGHVFYVVYRFVKILPEEE